MTLTMAVAAMLEGDLAAVRVLREASDIEIQRAWAALPAPVLRPRAVVAVLRALLDDESVAPLACDWAFFFQAGLMMGVDRPPAHGIDIEYEVAKEDEIVVALGRLAELGDLVDGEMSAMEIRTLIDDLQR